MGRVAAVGVILLLILALSLSGIWYVDQSERMLAGWTERALADCEARDAAGLLETIDGMESGWRERETLLSLYVRHDEIEKVNTSLVTLRACAETKAFDSAVLTLRQMQFLAGHIRERELPNLDNLL